MNDQNLENNDSRELDLLQLVRAVRKKIWLVVLASGMGAVLALAGTLVFVTPQYESAAMFYVNNSKLSVGGTALSISSGDLSTSRSLVDSYIVILNTRESLKDVIDYAGVSLTVEQLKDRITASDVNNTEIFQVVVTSPDPYEAEKIASAIACVLPKRIASIIEGTSAKVVDAAVVAAKPSSPSYANNTLLGLAIGLVLSVSYAALRDLFDTTIRSEADISLACPYPVLTEIPDMEHRPRGGYYIYSDEKSGKDIPNKQKRPVLVGEEICFAASEAYRLLRTKLQFYFADRKACHILGVSSALTGEGKSLSAINLACSLSQLNRKVVLIDCDMRCPTLFSKLSIKKKPGLSNLLAGQNDLDTVVQSSGMAGGGCSFSVIASGEVPPNPMELLCSARMEALLQALRQRYDFVILDLPPVGEISDALAIANQIDGYLLVVRQNYCSRLALKNAIRQLAFVEARILGIVYNCVTESSAGYGGHNYKNKYYAQGRNTEKGEMA